MAVGAGTARGGQGAPGGRSGGPSGGGKGGRAYGGALGRNAGQRAGAYGGRGRSGGIGSATAADRKVATDLGFTGMNAYGGYVDAISKQIQDDRNMGNTFGQNLGNVVASAFGVNESTNFGRALAAALAQDRAMAASGQQSLGIDAFGNDPNKAGWGFDPAGLIGTGLSAGFGVPGLGFAFDQISSMFDRPMEIGLGTSVFGNEPGSPTGSPAGPLGATVASNSQGMGGPLGGPGSWRDPRTGQLAARSAGPFGLAAGMPQMAAPQGSLPTLGTPGGGLLAGYQLSGPLAQRFGPGGTRDYRFG